MRARFDDLTPGGAGSWELVDPVDEIVARGPAEVVAALEKVEAAAQAGCWVAGWIAYQAAPGLDPTLTVRSGSSVPAVWFGVFAGRRALPVPDPPCRSRPAVEWVPSITPDDHAQALGVIRNEIEAGNTYQVNHTMRWRARWPSSHDTADAYAALVHAQRGAYHAYIDAGSHVILCASPELFLAWDADGLTTKPMKGTSRRGRWSAEDACRAAALARSAKDRAENVMIVDLLRNDLGRVAAVGTVAVERLWAVERFETVWQLTSTVRAKPRPEVSLVDVLAAMFPCGSVTGAPKRRTMDLIASVEDSVRGVYCGAVGWVGPPSGGSSRPQVRLAVAIRTVTVDVARGLAEYGSGGGITWSSSAAEEWAEVVAKTQVLTELRPEFQLLETMAFRPEHGIADVGAHLDRLGLSARYFGFAHDRDEVTATLVDALAGRMIPARVRLTADRDGKVVVSIGELPPEPTEKVTLAVDEQPVQSDDVFLHHKTTRREAFAERTARHPTVDDVVLVNERGEVTETTIANIAVELGGVWCTPPQHSGCLAGIERGRLVASGCLTERVITVADLLTAPSVALVSSVRGWRPTIVVEG